MSKGRATRGVDDVFEFVGEEGAEDALFVAVFWGTFLASMFLYMRSFRSLMLPLASCEVYVCACV